MAVRHVVAAAFLVAATFAATRAVYSQDKPAEPPKMPSEEEMMKMAAERAALVDEHKKLAEFVGTWDAVMIATGMDGKETREAGTTTIESVLGGRALLTRYKGTMMGQPYEGIGLEGYDKEKKQNWSIWCDTTGTSSMKFTGTRNADGFVAMKSEAFDCGMGPCTMDYVMKVTDKDHMTMESVTHMSGMDMPWRIEYTRAK